jgi:hypothetical protein
MRAAPVGPYHATVGNGTNHRIRRLTSTEIEAYDHIPSELARKVWLVDIGYLPGPYLGLTLGRFVLLADMGPATGTDLLLAHELVHVRQWTELGVAGFSYRYLRDFAVGLRRHRRWRIAYAQIEAEEEARRLTDAWAQRRVGAAPGASVEPGQSGV